MASIKTHTRRLERRWIALAGEGVRLPPVLSWVERGLAPRHALAVGIHDALAERVGVEPGSRLLRHFLAGVVGTLRYQSLLAKPGAMRADLDGKPVEPVAEDARAVAADRVAERRYEQQQRVRRVAADKARQVAARNARREKERAEKAAAVSVEPSPSVRGPVVRTKRSVLSLASRRMRAGR